MRIHGFRSVLMTAAAGIAVSAWSPVRAGDFIVDLGKAVELSLVGAVQRWDEEGKTRLPVDPKAKIAEPRVDARAVRQGGGKWIFRNLPPGRYDLVVLGVDHLRVEGFRYPPINEFDLFLAPDAKAPEEETRDWIVKHIAGSKHYENKVVPLFLAGDEKQVRILLQLVRDQPTSYDGDFGAPVATVRHEIWQYSNQYGGWVKDRRTEVLDRILMARSEFQRWTWVWEPRLGGIEVSTKPVTVTYELPEKFDPHEARGWFPN
jgi:hypothetical protein